MSASFIKPLTGGTVQQDGLSKDDLENQIVAFSLVEEDPAFETQFGPSAKAVCNLTVVDTGARDAEFHAFGNLAKQMTAAVGGTVGAATIVRVIKGQSGTRSFWGVEEISQTDWDKALRKMKKDGSSPLDAPAADSPAPF